ncbi:MAG TPA: tetratricopeptide repeat protein [Acidobacteriaceae bacterium]|nr:tetratricopeptide repeat protein [Acidobacteriaceae bacterium]
MRATGKIALVFACLTVIAVSCFGWRAHQIRTHDAKRAAAIERYREQAVQGDPLAEALLARMCADGDGLPQDYRRALDLYRKSANQGSRAGEAGLGATYYYGRGVPVDYKTAFMWYSKAAAQGNPYAENATGIMLEHGNGTAQDYAQAASWYRKAAERDYPGGEYNLGRMYWYGRTFPQDRTEAYRWFRKAAAGGDEDARDFLSAGLSPICETALLVEFLGGLILVLGAFPIKTNSWNQPRQLSLSARNTALGAGGFCILTSAYSWYGYTHHLFRRLGAGVNAFTASRWVLDGAAILALVYILRSNKRNVKSPDEASVQTQT